MVWHAVADAGAIGDEAVLAVTVGDEPIAICRSGGTLYAVHDVCTHQYALLSDGYVEDGCIECPMHQGRFDLATGKATCAPATEPIRTFAIKVEGGKVLIEMDA